MIDAKLKQTLKTLLNFDGMKRILSTLIEILEEELKEVPESQYGEESVKYIINLK